MEAAATSLISIASSAEKMGTIGILVVIIGALIWLLRKQWSDKTSIERMFREDAEKRDQLYEKVTKLIDINMKSAEDTSRVMNYMLELLKSKI